MALYFIARPAYSFGANWEGTKVAAFIVRTDEFISWRTSVGNQISTVILLEAEAHSALNTGAADIYVTNSLEAARTIAGKVPGGKLLDVNGTLLGETPPAEPPPTNPGGDDFHLILRKNLGIDDIDQLSGATIALVIGSRAEQAVADYFRTHDLEYNPIVFISEVEAIAAYEAGRADAVALSPEMASSVLKSNRFLTDPSAHRIVEPDGPPPAGPIFGDAGDNLIYGIEASQVIDGGAGMDTVVYAGQLRVDTPVELQADATLLVTKPGGIDTLISVERVKFDDGTLALDFEGNAGQAYRLYQAAFDRVPDTEGLGYWIGRLDSGTTSLKAVADSFLQSPEFVKTYGTQETVSNAQFVELLYRHTLDRNYEQEGFDYWVERLDGGHTNRADLLAFFSESDENVASVSPVVQNGVWFT